ncbi:MAG: extracellular solute-binding protein [Chloroflexota bacterium]|nr:extracellular solute-binding protein [Chloroflexota bacterium]
MRSTGRFSRRSLLGWGGVVGGGVLLAACGAQTGAMEGEGEMEAKEEEAPKAEQADTKEMEPRLIVHTDWWRPGGAPTIQEYFDGIKGDFMELNPGITVESVHVRGTIGLQDHVTTMIAAGEQVDSSQVSVAFILNWLLKDFLAPLDPYQAADPSMAPDKFVDSGRFFNQHGGQTYGIPYDGPSTTVVGLNTRLLTDAGLDTDREVTWNWDWDTFLEYAQQAHEVSGDNIVRMGYRPGSFSIYHLGRWVYVNGGRLYSDDNSAAVFDSPQAIAGGEFMQDLKLKHKFDPVPEGATFQNEQIVMDIQGSWRVGYLLGENPDLEFDFTPYPQGPDGAAPGSLTWTNQWCLFGVSPDPDLAWSWIAWVNSEATLEKYFAGILSRNAGRKEFYQSEPWQKIVAERPVLKDIETIADTSGPYPWIHTSAGNEATKPVWDALNNQELTVQEALPQAVKLLNGVLEELGT